MPPGLIRSDPGELSWPKLIGFGVLSLVCVAGIGYFMFGATSHDPGANGTLSGPGFSVTAKSCTIGIGTSTEAVQNRRLPLDGVKVVGQNGGSLFVHREGGHVIVKAPDCTHRGCKIRLDAENCEVYDVDIGWTGAVHNNHDIWAGHANLKCAVEGGAVEGSVDFPSCG